MLGANPNPNKTILGEKMGIVMICLACLFIGFVIGYASRDYELHKTQ